jgi:hypothetical protein
MRQLGSHRRFDGVLASVLVHKRALSVRQGVVPHDIASQVIESSM